MMRTIALAVLLLTAGVAEARAQATVFLVRHAERADAGMATAGTMGTDPDLSPEGRARAESLAAALKDAGITAIYATEYRRTQQTAAPLARALGLKVTTIKSGESAPLMQALNAATGNVLVVGHSNTVPAVIKQLGVTVPVTIGESDYDNLFIVTTGAEPRMIRLHFR
jgi:broad specificity phosphatase PhoE